MSGFCWLSVDSSCTSLLISCLVIQLVSAREAVKYLSMLVALFFLYIVLTLALSVFKLCYFVPVHLQFLCLLRGMFFFDHDIFL